MLSRARSIVLLCGNERYSDPVLHQRCQVGIELLYRSKKVYDSLPNLSGQILRRRKPYLGGVALVWPRCLPCLACLCRAPKCKSAGRSAKSAPDRSCVHAAVCAHWKCCKLCQYVCDLRGCWVSPLRSILRSPFVCLPSRVHHHTR